MTPDRRADPGLDETLAYDAAVLLDAVVHVDAPPPPPPEVRDRVRRAVAAVPGAGPRPAAPLDVYARQVAVLSEVLAGLTAEEWSAPAAPYPWDVHGLVAHLLAIDRLTAASLGLGDPPDDPAAGHLEVGAALIEEQRRGAPTSTADDWRSCSAATVRHLSAPDAPPLDTPVMLHGVPFSLASLLVVRGFELWTHTDDVRRAIGREPVPPTAEDVTAMSGVSVGSLPAVLSLLSPDTVGSARVVLTGDGGGTWPLALGAGAHPGGPSAGGAPSLLLVADAVDWCRMVARRLDPSELELETEGDRGLVAPILEAARVLAV